MTTVAAGAERTKQGVATVEQARAAFEAIDAAAGTTTERVGGISSSVAQIVAEAERAESEIGDVGGVAEASAASAEQVSASTQQTSATSPEVAASATELARTADELERLVRRFELA